MGKGFNNYMCKKFFHPASRDNLKRVWMAEQKAEAYKKKQEELRLQYEKEQDLYNNKALLSSESKDKLSVNFLYEPPPGAKKEREKEDDEPEYKFEWQRRFNAPREDYCKDNQEIRDQPFGIQVRNVRCIKCHKWGHINTDKECPLYNQSISSIQGSSAVDPMTLVQQMRDDGLALKRSALALQSHMTIPTHAHHLIPSSDDEEQDAEKIREDEMQFLKSLSTKQKQKLLKKLEKLEKGKSSKKKDKKKSKKSKKSKDTESSSSSSSDSSSDSDREHSRKKKRAKKSRKRDSSTSSSSSEDKPKHKKAKLSEPKSSKHKDERSKVKEEHVTNWLKEVRNEVTGNSSFANAKHKSSRKDERHDSKHSKRRS